jgi:hypothetical protein
MEVINKGGFEPPNQNGTYLGFDEIFSRLNPVALACKLK